MADYLFYGMTIILGIMFIFTLVKKPKILNRFEAIWLYILLYFWGVCGLALLKYPTIPILILIFCGIAGFLLWVIILIIFRRPKFEHRGAIVATCLIGIILYLFLFYLDYSESGTTDLLQEMLKEVMHK